MFQATDMAAWQRFAVDIIGMQLGECDPARYLALRLDDQAQRILMEHGDDMVAVGWELDNEGMLEAIVAQVVDKGVAVEQGDEHLCSSRRVERVYRCTDPNGLQHELYYGPAIAPMDQTFRSSVLRGNFVAGRLGGGHYVTSAVDKAETDHFYRHVLGLRLSDFIRREVAPGGPVLDATFMHAATGRHHSAAFASMPLQKQIHHCMVQVEDMNDVGLAWQRCKAAGVPFLMDLGHHPNDQMFSFYVVTPGGFGLEVGWGGIVIDDDDWEVRSYSQLSDWGHEHREGH